jgi:hypothetical protein
MTKAWSRWEDWVAVVLGVVAALTPIWVATNAAATSSLLVLGVLTAVIGLWSLGQPGALASEWITLVLGVLLFLAPWVLGYSALSGAAWTSWVIGVIDVIMAAAALPAANTAHRGLTAQH